MSETEPQDFALALEELIQNFSRKGVAMDEIAVALEEAAIKAGEDDEDDEPEPEVGGDAA